MEIKIMKNILDRNQNKANEVRNLLVTKKLLMVNIISSPGAGKTTLLERTCESLCEKYRIGVIEGDITTDRDALRLKKLIFLLSSSIPKEAVILIPIVYRRYSASFDLDNLDVLFVENVGNLICPSQFDLGEDFQACNGQYNGR